MTKTLGIILPIQLAFPAGFALATHQVQIATGLWAGDFLPFVFMLTLIYITFVAALLFGIGQGLKECYIKIHEKNISAIISFLISLILICLMYEFMSLSYNSWYITQMQRIIFYTQFIDKTACVIPPHTKAAYPINGDVLLARWNKKQQQYIFFKAPCKSMNSASAAF